LLIWGINMKKCISVFLYLGLVVVFLGFDIKELFDLKQMLLVVTGTVILYIPSLETGSKFKIDKELVGQNALWASLIQTFVLFYNVLATDYVEEERFLNTALSCRPLLYGFCIWIILHNDEVPEETIIEETEQKMARTEVTEDIIQDCKVQETIESKDKYIETETRELKGDLKQGSDFIVKVSLPGIEECRQQFLSAGLTRRETEVALLILKCMSNAEIAEELFISETTVKKHVSNIFAKLKISKREQIRNILY